MNSTLRRSLLSLSIATVASAGLLAGCEQKTTTQSPDGTTTTTTTTTVAPVTPSPETTASMKSTAKEIGNDASQAMTKVGNAVEDGVITAKVKTALLADPDVKGLKIDVDTKNGVVTLSGTVEKNANLDRAVKIARDTDGVKSVENQLVVKA
jgi:hyperosmotically inducible periplasmic protein